MILVSVFPVNWAAGLILLGTAPLIPLFMIPRVGAADANRRNFQSLARLSGHFLDRLKGLSTRSFHAHLGGRGRPSIRCIGRFSRAHHGGAAPRLSEHGRAGVLRRHRGGPGWPSTSVSPHIDHPTLAAMASGHPLYRPVRALPRPEFYAPLRNSVPTITPRHRPLAQPNNCWNFLEADVSEPAPDAPSMRMAPSGEARSLEVLSAEGKVLVGPLDFTLEAGTRTALVGISGAGKSSLVNALLGFAPYRGSCCQRVELRTLDISQWRQQLGWLSQNPQLFHSQPAGQPAAGHHPPATPRRNRAQARPGPGVRQ